MFSIKYVVFIVIWSAIVFLSVYFFLDNVIAYFYGYRSPMFGNSFFQNQVWVVTHMIGGTLTLFTGPFQFWSYIRKRFTRFHKVTGKVYMFGILLIGISAGRLSLISSCIPCRISLFLLTVFAVISTFFAWKAIQARNIKVHRQMMVRSYICVLAFVLVRVDDVFPLDFLFGKVDNPVYARVVQEYFWSFVPLLVAEVVMVWCPQVFVKRKQ